MNQITQIPPAKQARSFQLKSRCMAGHSCHYCIHANTRRHLHKHTDTVRSSPEADNTLVRLLLLAVSLRLYKGLQMTAFDPTPPPPLQLTGCLPTSLWQDLCNAHTESSDTEPGMRKIFTCVEEVNKCSLFTCWYQSHPPVLDLKACGGGGWIRWDEGRLSATWRRGALRMLRNGKCWWNCQINTLVREKSLHASMSLWSESEWGHLTSRADTGKQTDVCVNFLTAYWLNHLCVHSVVMNRTQKRALISSLILALMFLHID